MSKPGQVHKLGLGFRDSSQMSNKGLNWRFLGSLGILRDFTGNPLPGSKQPTPSLNSCNFRFQMRDVLLKERNNLANLREALGRVLFLASVLC